VVPNGRVLCAATCSLGEDRPLGDPWYQDAMPISLQASAAAAAVVAKAAGAGGEVCVAHPAISHGRKMVHRAFMTGSEAAMRGKIKGGTAECQATH
jgi:hypothetical protein